MRQKQLIETLVNKFNAVVRNEWHIQVPADLGARTWHNIYFNKNGNAKLQLYNEEVIPSFGNQWIIESIRGWQEQYNGIIDLKPA